MARRPEISESVTLRCRDCGLTTFAPGWRDTVEALRAIHERTCEARRENNTLSG